MPQLIVLGLAGILAFYCWKKLREELNRLNERAEEKPKPQGRRKDSIETLKQDPKTGVYRVEDE